MHFDAGNDDEHHLPYNESHLMRWWGNYIAIVLRKSDINM